MANNWLRSPIIYWGNKFKLLDFINENLPEGIDTIVDCFGGSGVVSLNFGFKGKKVIYNELDPKIVELIQVFLRNDLKDIERWMVEITKETELENFRTEKQRTKQTEEQRKAETKKWCEAKNHLNAIREYTPRDEWVIKAFRISRLGIFNRYVFKGEDLSGQPGSYKEIKPDVDKIANFKYAFKAEIINGSYVDVLNKLICQRENEPLNEFDELDEWSNIFVYLDPPYFNTSADYNSNWKKEDEDRLLGFLKELDGFKIKWMLSNIPNDHLIEFAKTYGYYTKIKKYKHSSISGADKEVEEFIMMNYKPKEKPKQIRLFE